VKRIPFVPLPLEKVSKISRVFLWLASRLVKLNPFLAQSLVEAGIEYKDREYMSIAIFSSVFWFFLIFPLFVILGIIVRQDLLSLAVIFSFLVSGISLFYVMFYPSLIVTKKNRDIEKNLLFAIRHLFIQVKSGVSLFDAMVSISKNNYGLISEEFDQCTKEIATGKEETLALEELAFKTPNIDFKKIIWQIVNSLKAGGDIGNTLNVMAQELSDEQKVKIRKYGSQLSPMALMYLMSTAILPTLGITFLIIFSTFSGIQVPDVMFYLILVIVTVFQFMFIGIIKSRRPSVEI
jgi:flagellar protein FlaJ